MKIMFDKMKYGLVVKKIKELVMKNKGEYI